MGTWPAVIPLLGMAMFGGLIFCCGLLLLGEYRDAFFRDPRAMMTLEVFMRVGGGAGPGYLAMLLLFVGALFILAAIACLLMLIGLSIFELFSLTGNSDGS